MIECNCGAGNNGYKSTTASPLPYDNWDKDELVPLQQTAYIGLPAEEPQRLLSAHQVGFDKFEVYMPTGFLALSRADMQRLGVELIKLTGATDAPGSYTL